MPAHQKRLPRYPTHAAWLADELRWIRARARHRIARRNQSALVAQFPVTVPDEARESARLSLFAWGERVVENGRAANAWRQEIDHRLNTGRMGRKPMTLDRVQRSLDLDEFERMVVLLTGAPLLQRELEPLYDDLGGRHLEGACTPAVIFELLGQFDEQRVALRARFAAEAPLRQHGLLSIAAEPHHPDFLDARLSLTERGLATLLGTPEHPQPMPKTDLTGDTHA